MVERWDRDAENWRPERVDIAIVCALPEELRPVLNFADVRERWTKFTLDQFMHYFVELPSDAGSLNVVACTLRKEGGDPATAAVMRLKALRPRLLVMTGFCAGRAEGGVQLGDVIIASRAFRAGEGKQTDAGFEPDIQTYQPPSWLMQWLQDSTFDHTWTTTITTPHPHHRTPSLHIGPFASTEAVIAKGEPFEQLSKQMRKVLAIDLEVASFLSAADEIRAPVFAVKGVSDFATPEKNDSFHTYAAEASACWLFGFIRHYAAHLPERAASTLDASRVIPSVPGWAGRETVLARRNRKAILRRASMYIKGLLSSVPAESRIASRFIRRPDAVDVPFADWYQEHRPELGELALPVQLQDMFANTGGDLLILGEPGSGKSTLLAELVGDLIGRAEQRADHPIPLLFNLSSWAEKRQPLGEWLIDELHTRYKVPRAVGREWIDHNELLLFLDGLDEVKTDHRAACVDAINLHRRAHSAPIVVSSRTADYDALANKLQLEAAIIIQPLTIEQIDGFLAQRGEQVAGLRSALAHSAELRQLAATPLMLYIMAEVYRGQTPAQIIAAGTGTDQQRRLCDTYIGILLNRRSKREAFSRHQTVGWLAGMARRMLEQNQTNCYIERLQPAWLTTTAQRLAYSLSIRSVVGWIAGLILGVIALWDSRDPWFALIFVPLSGFIFGFLWERTGRLAIKLPLRSALTIHIGIAEGLAYGLLYTIARTWTSGLSFGALENTISMFGRSGLVGVGLGMFGAGLLRIAQIEFSEPLEWSWRAAVTRGIVIGSLIGGVNILGYRSPVAGILIGLATLFASGLTRRKDVTPQDFRDTRSSLRRALAWGSICGILFGLATGIWTGLSRSVAEGTLSGAGYGLSAMLVLVMAFGGFAYLQHLTLRAVLDRAGVFPWKYKAFLEYASERGFLLRVGGGYQFYHRLLQESFAALPDASAAEQPPRTRRTLLYVSIMVLPIVITLLTLGLSHLTFQHFFGGRVDSEQYVRMIEQAAIAQARPVPGRREAPFPLRHTTSDDITFQSLNCGLSDFIAEAQFSNPYDRYGNGNWDYGFFFRLTHGEAWHQYRLSVHADQMWALDFVHAVNQGTESSFEKIASGRLDMLDVSPNGSNTLRLIARGGEALFFVNDIYVATLDISKQQGAGCLRVGTGFYEGADLKDAETKVNAYSLFALD